MLGASNTRMIRSGTHISP